MKINNKKEYSKVAKEIGWDFKKINYTSEVLTNFDYWDTVNSFLDDTKVVLDVGCGRA